MSTNITSTAKKPLSGLFTAIAVILFLGGFYLAGSALLAAQPWYFRLGVVVVTLLVSCGALMLTEYWLRIKSLTYGARIEMRKVFWPTKDELVKTTLMVLAIVAVFAIFLTIVDGLLTLLIQWVL